MVAPGQRIAVDVTSPGAARLVEWIEAELGGAVVALERLARWRLGWFADVACGDSVVELYVRGARGPDFPSPYPLEHEVVVHDMLEAQGFPVPHVYGLVDLGFTTALVMDRVPGAQGLASAPDDATRRRLMLECIDLMAKMHRIGEHELVARGFDMPRTSDEIVWSGAIARLEAHYLGSSAPPDPVIEFLRRWLWRNRPRDRTRAAFVTWDAAQFLHHEGELTALIDFELAHVGDPYMDLAPLRSRDTTEPFGDLRGAFARYAAVTGEPVDLAIVRYFEVSQLTATLMLQRPVMLAPDPNSDLVTHIVWYVESARYAFDVLAEIHGITLDVVDAIDAPASSHAVAHEQLVRSLHAASRTQVTPADIGDTERRWRARCDYRLARHLQRVDEIGALVDAAELDDGALLLGHDLADRRALDAALVARIACEDPADDIALLTYLNRRVQRSSMLLGPRDARLVQHVPMQPLE
jgi:aminoglycoside phosphotransferase (APT) family kinase protein